MRLILEDTPMTFVRNDEEESLGVLLDTLLEQCKLRKDVFVFLPRLSVPHDTLLGHVRIVAASPSTFDTPERLVGNGAQVGSEDDEIDLLELGLVQVRPASGMQHAKIR